MSSPRRRGYDLVKRALDAVTAAIALIVLSPVMAVVAGLVAVDLGRPVIFAQDRPGRDARIFRLYKFRSMKPVSGDTVHDADRLTRFGRVLRSTSLDELPSFWNVLTGDMSVVGPRPLLVEYLPLYSDEQATRHEVRPGITGLAQVRGRNELSWEEKFTLDAVYVRGRSFLLDAKIIVWTFVQVLRRDGITAEGSATAEPFRGGSRDGGVAAPVAASDSQPLES